MSTKAFFLCWGGSNLIFGIGTENHIFVYQMGRLCGGAHEISGIKAPIFLHGWVGGGGMGVCCRVGGGGEGVVGWWWVGVGVVGWVVVGWGWVGVCVVGWVVVG